MKRGNWGLLEPETIPAPDGSPYLSRLRIFMTPWVSLYLHKIHASDGDRARHDHPWSFWSLIVRGGYVESVAPVSDPFKAKLKAHTAGRAHRHPMSICHRIETIIPGTITLVLTGRRRDTWGFYTEDRGFVPWQDYERG